MQSEPGDYIGGGRTYAFTPADGTFSANGNWDGGVSLSFHGWDWAEWWYLDFAAADAAPLAVGVYPGATRFPFQGPGEPGLDVSGDGRGCNMLTGSFEVKEIAFGAANDVLAFRATFEQHCEGWPAALTGEIRYNATVPVALSAPAAVTAPTAAWTWAARCSWRGGTSPCPPRW